MSEADFTQLLAFFGFKCTSSKPCLNDIYHFTQLFNDHDLTSVDGFKRFIEAFDLKKYYAHDNNVCVPRNAHRFGWPIRSVTRIRFSHIEGQHRWWCFSSFIQGFFKVSTLLPCEFTPLQNHPEKHQDPSTWQSSSIVDIRFVTPLTAKNE